jgi:hypothetical protein
MKFDEGCDGSAPVAMENITRRIASGVGTEALALEEALEENWRFLLSRRGGFSEFSVLPMRITKLLGYLAAASIIGDELKMNGGEYDDVAAQKLVRRLINRYGMSIGCVSDAQSSEIAIFFGSRLSTQLAAESDSIFGSLFADFVARKGSILKERFNGRQMFRLTWERATGQKFGKRDYLARPTSMLGVLLAASRMRHLEDTVDPYLHELDHHAMNIFIPKRLSDFSRATIEDGVNVSFTVGSENLLGVFTTDDFKSAFDNHCCPLITTLMNGTSRAAKLGAVVASLVLPDRVCWQLLAKGTH